MLKKTQGWSLRRTPNDAAAGGGAEGASGGRRLGDGCTGRGRTRRRALLLHRAQAERSRLLDRPCDPWIRGGACHTMWSMPGPPSPID